MASDVVFGNARVTRLTSVCAEPKTGAAVVSRAPKMWIWGAGLRGWAGYSRDDKGPRKRVASRRAGARIHIRTILSVGNDSVGFQFIDSRSQIISGAEKVTNFNDKALRNNLGHIVLNNVCRADAVDRLARDGAEKPFPSIEAGGCGGVVEAQDVIAEGLLVAVFSRDLEHSLGACRHFETA